MSINKEITLLDGGMGRAIKAEMSNFDLVLWSASALIWDPNLVVRLHKRFIEAGADIITTNNYTVVPTILKKAGREDEFESLLRLSGELAKQAVEESNKNICIAASLPPLESTYRPDLVGDFKENVAIYKQIVNALDPFSDIFLIESLSAIDEAKSALEALRGIKKPVWVSFILDDTNNSQLLSGESISDIEERLEAYHFDVLSFNCCMPETIKNALKSHCFTKPLAAYANAFQKLEKITDYTHGKPRADREGITPSDYVFFAKEWIDLGVSKIGGCCGIGEEHILALSKQFKLGN